MRQHSDIGSESKTGLSVGKSIALVPEYCAVPFAYVSLQVLADEQRVARSCPLETSASLHLKTRARHLN